MATVKVLVPGVGEWKQGEIVTDAPDGLVEIAKKGTKHAPTGRLIAELIEDDVPAVDVEALRARAKELNIRGWQNMKPETLQASVAAVEEALESQKAGDGTNTPTNDGDADLTNDGAGGNA